MKKTQTEPEEQKPHRSTGKTLTYIGTVVLLVLIVVAFVGAPALTGVASGSRPVFGSYAGREILYEPGNYLAREFDSIARQVQASGQEVSEFLVRQIWREAFNRTVLHYATLHEAEQAGVAVSERAVDRAVAQWPEFQVDGRFSARAFENTSSQQRFALRQYLRGGLVGSIVRDDMLVEPSQAEQSFIVDMAGPERRFRFVQFSSADFPVARVVQYGEANRERFASAELSVITVTSRRADADAIRQQAIDRVASFEDLARNQSTDSFAADGGSMGSVYFHELELDFETMAPVREIFALSEGAISPVYETQFGWVIYRMDRSPVDPDFTDSGLIADIRGYLNVFERGLVEDFLRDRANAFATAAREDGFGAAALSIDQSPQLTSWFPINFGNLPFFATVETAANPALASAANRADFFVDLFGLAPGDVSAPILARDYFFVLELDAERTVDENIAQYLSLVAPQIVEELQNAEIRRAVVDETLLVDTFALAFNRMMR